MWVGAAVISGVVWLLTLWTLAGLFGAFERERARTEKLYSGLQDTLHFIEADNWRRAKYSAREAVAVYRARMKN